MHLNKDVSGKEIRTSLKWQANRLPGKNKVIQGGFGTPYEAPTLVLIYFYVFPMLEEKFWNVFLLVKFLAYAVDTDFSVLSA